jgi:hypothetical protein
MIVTRHARPFLFWTSIVSCVVFGAAAIAAYALSFGYPMFSK